MQGGALFFFVLSPAFMGPHLRPMKALRTIFWALVALVFGIVAVAVIVGTTTAAGLLILRDILFRPKTDSSKWPLQ